jgi:hypothetical protein
MSSSGKEQWRIDSDGVRASGERDGVCRRDYGWMTGRTNSMSKCAAIAASRGHFAGSRGKPRAADATTRAHADRRRSQSDNVAATADCSGRICLAIARTELIGI